MIFRCEVCGCVIDEKKPAVCPVCGGKDEFVKMNDFDEEKVDSARTVNEILMELLSTVSNGIEIALEAKDEDPDQSTDKILNRILVDFPEIRAMIYAQLGKNAREGRWG